MPCVPPRLASAALLAAVLLVSTVPLSRAQLLLDMKALALNGTDLGPQWRQIDEFQEPGAPFYGVTFSRSRSSVAPAATLDIVLFDDPGRTVSPSQVISEVSEGLRTGLPPGRVLVEFVPPASARSPPRRASHCGLGRSARRPTCSPGVRAACSP